MWPKYSCYKILSTFNKIKTLKTVTLDSYPTLSSENKSENMKSSRKRKYKIISNEHCRLTVCYIERK
jgi:hypothetical protein